ncbi:efflux RND transporter periplasmic adaptor subunit [Mesorhizobium sp. AaZ16]|uniref:efflux RND transporter periplasmic adaptor subunit n=1 Tax=Mesorhizobium sp. AaZ16 TaxID=3402289 RepID=UPI00374E8743
MAAWKQFLIAAVIMVAAAAAWVRFFPGAPEILASWGIEWALAATPKAESPAEGSRQGRGGPGAKAAVVTRPVVPATINDKLSAIGTGRANKSVTVKPYSAGRLTELVVASGSRIRAGDVIAKLDSDAEEIAVDRARIAMADAEARVERIKALRSSNTATAVQMTEAELALGNARLAVRDAELALERRSIEAPISGIVGILPVEAGNYVATETAVATLDDRSSIIVDFWVPERYASAITVGMPMSATSIARPNQVFEGAVSAVDNRLDEASRTLHVRARIGNPDDTLRAGMSFQVSMRFAGDTYPSVDPLAIQWGADGAFVWAIGEDGRAKRTPVRIVQRNTESVLIDADIRAGVEVVTEGIHVVREGAELLIAGREPSASAMPTPLASGSGS